MSSVTPSPLHITNPKYLSIKWGKVTPSTQTQIDHINYKNLVPQFIRKPHHNE